MCLMRRFSLLLLCLVPLISLAQTPRADSLRQVLGDAQFDTMHVNMLGELAYLMRSVKPDSALLVGHQSYQLAREIKFDQKIDNILRVLGIIHFYDNNADSALWYFERSEELARELGDKMTLASVVMNQATLYKSQNNIPKALEAYERALNIEKERGNKAGQGAAFNNIGAIYLDQKAYDKAEQYFLEGLKIQEEIGNKAYQVVLLGNLSLAASFQNNFEQSIDYYQKSLALARELQNREQESFILVKMGLAYKINGRFPQSLDYYLQNLKLWESLASEPKTAAALNFLGQLYEENNDLDSADSYYKRSLSIYEKIGDNKNRATKMANLGNIYIKRQKYRGALSYLIPALGILEEVGSVESRISAGVLQGIGSCYENLNQLDSATFYLQKALNICEKVRAEGTHSKTLLSLGKTHEKRGEVEKAISVVEEAVRIARTSGLKKIQSEIAEALYRLYKTQDKSAQALAYLEMYKALQDSIFNKENTRALAQIEANYKFEQEKQQLSYKQEQKLAEERNTQKAILIALVVAVLVIMAFAWYYFQKQKANKILMALNDEIHEQKTKLEQLDTLKSRFFTNISHEFRTPLTVIGGMVDQIETNQKKWMKKGLDLIRRNNNQLLDLVNQILDLRKLEAGTMRLNMTQGDIVFYLRYILESFQSLAETKDITLHYLCQYDQLMMDFDREKLLRVVSNLLSNAIKFTPEGGHIYLSIHKVSHAENGARTDTLKLLVKDSGIGIPIEKLPYIFDRFYQVDDSSTRRGEGTGIGLALTKELVNLMNGNISVQSKRNKGTVFTIKIPISHEAIFHDASENDLPLVVPNASHMEAPITSPASPYLSNRIKLLIIEDNADVVTYLESILADTYHLLIARDGQEGINVAIAEVPDLIISDIMMPLKDGFEVCETLKEDERTSHIPIVLLTAKADEESKLGGLKRGADAYLTKPFNQQELFIRLEQLLKLRQKLQARYANLEYVPPREEALQQEDEFITKVREIVETNLQNAKLGVPMLCDSMGLSRTQFYMKLKALTGRSGSSFIRTIRLHKAKDLLQDSESTVSQVAYEVGFADPAYFSRTFSEEFGFSPKDFASQKL